MTVTTISPKAAPTQIPGVRWRIDAYEEWLAKEGLPVATGLAVDPFKVETRPWARLGANAAVIHLDARGDFQNLYLVDLAPGQTTERQHHLYEAVAYVLDGTGSTVVELSGGQKRSFEWRRGSMFAVPVNVGYKLFNASGKDRARIAMVSNLPMLMKLFRNERFIFDTPFDFTERHGDDKFFRGEGTFIPVAEHRNQWETNFVPDLLTFDQMRISNGRGRGSTNIMFILADGTMHAHMSGIPAGNYKKSHRHREGFHIFQLSGAGYSLYHKERDFVAAGEEPVRVDWTYGLLHAPPKGTWHQHFNVAAEEGRYIAMNFGSLRYPFFTPERPQYVDPLAPFKPHDDQIEYEDEDPYIRTLFDKEVAAYRAGTSKLTFAR